MPQIALVMLTEFARLALRAAAALICLDLAIVMLAFFICLAL